MAPRSLALLLVLAATPVLAGPGAQTVRVELGELSPASLRGVWVGEFHQLDPGRSIRYPMRMEIAEVAGDSRDAKIVGTLGWPTLRDSVTRLEGHAHVTAVEFTESELLRGSDIILHGTYRAAFAAPDRLEGFWLPPADYHGTDLGTFVLRRTDQEPGLAGETWLGGDGLGRPGP